LNEHQPVEIDDLDRAILNQIQSDFPIQARPYEVLGRRLSQPPDEVLARVRRMRQEGLIRRIGGNFSSRAVGYASTLCAARVPVDKLPIFVETVNRFPGVTHNYRRNHEFNVWFTFIAPSMEEIEANLKKIAEETGVEEIYNLPAIRTFKIKVDFKFEEGEAE
jgi:DNA-binding Lrp family transcriptional regulator